MIYGKANLRVLYAIWGPFNLLLLLLVFSLYICFIFSYSVVLGYSVLFLFSLFVFFAFQFSRILLIYSLAQIFLFSVMSGLLISPSKALFSSVTVVLFFIYPPPLWFFVRISISLLILPICSCMPSTLLESLAY